MHPTQTPPNGPGITPAEVLHCAALYLYRHGWHQGDMFDLDHANLLTPPACVQGAVKMAICGDPHAGYTPQQAALLDQALTVLAGDLDLSDGDPEPWAAAVLVADWNDTTERTAAEVITALDEAADGWTTTHLTTTADITSGGAA